MIEIKFSMSSGSIMTLKRSGLTIFIYLDDKLIINFPDKDLFALIDSLQHLSISRFY
jgi:hypothetical protein